MEVIRLTVGQLATNCYILFGRKGKGLGKEGIVIDPGGDCEKIAKVVQQYNIKVKAIVNTHMHDDHTLCNEYLKESWNCQILAGVGADRILNETDTIEIGQTKLRVFETPGHCSGSISLFSVKDNYLFCGDVLFKSGVGRVDLPGGNKMELKATIDKLLKLSGDTIVCPGHGEIFTIAEWKNKNFSCI